MNTTAGSLCISVVSFFGVALFAHVHPASVASERGTPSVDERSLHVLRVDRLAGLAVQGPNKKDVGSLDGLIVDSNTGRLAYAVIGQSGLLGVGEHEHLVPWAALQFGFIREKESHEETATARATLDREQIASCPAFEKGAAIGAETERKAFEGAKLPPDPDLGRGVSQRLVCTRDLDGCKVESKSGDDLGRIRRVLVDPLDARVVFTVLESSRVPGAVSKSFALPWPVTQLCLDKDRKVVLITPLVKERLAAAPQYVEGDWKQMTNPAWLRELALYHDVEPYWIHEPAPER